MFLENVSWLSLYPSRTFDNHRSEYLSSYILTYFCRPISLNPSGFFHEFTIIIMLDGNNKLLHYEIFSPSFLSLDKGNVTPELNYVNKMCK
jgi:hypothetical protein